MGWKRGLLAVACAALTLSAGTAAEARPGSDPVQEMALGPAAPPPGGYYEFCLRRPADCIPTGATASSEKPNYWAFAFHSAAVQRRFAGRRPAADPPGSIRAQGAGRAKAWRRPALVEDGDGAPRLGADGRIALTAGAWSTLNRVNRDVNRQVTRVSDQAMYGLADVWTLPLSAGGDGRGDCEDFVMEKRHQLLRAGYPMQALSVALARTRRGETHAVLLVETDAGALALDSFSGRIRPWWKLDYQWIMRQSPKDPTVWVAVLGEGWPGWAPFAPG